MKKIRMIASVIPLFLLFCSYTVRAEEYIIIGWNDLGMHCSNKYFSVMAVLPPYNNLTAQVIRRGSANTFPALMDSFSVTYEIPGNTYSVGKTDFWTYAEQLFGVTLPPNIGLTMLGLTGKMSDLGGYFRAEGIPLTPFTDANLESEDPYQLALLKAYDSQNNLVSSTRTVIPVSNEISCVSAMCHGSEAGIFAGHEDNLPQGPILCASCHSSNALGTKGKPEVPSLSQAIHDQHAEATGITCYNCHPGKVTKCLRDVMFSRGMTCTDCHGDLANIANSIENGRQPWLQEPQCGNSLCHGRKGNQYAEESGKLFRQSKGHGGLYCSACHGSPHAILPTVIARDNEQVIALQGESGTLRKCTVCHGVTPTFPGPHGIVATGVKETADLSPLLFRLDGNAPNPFNPATTISFTLFRSGPVSLTVYDITGRLVRTLVEGTLSAGTHTVIWDGGNNGGKFVSTGVYLSRLSMGGKSLTGKMALIR